MALTCTSCMLGIHAPGVHCVRCGAPLHVDCALVALVGEEQEPRLEVVCDECWIAWMRSLGGTDERMRYLYRLDATARFGR
jgi:hypothetical protein